MKLKNRRESDVKNEIVLCPFCGSISLREYNGVYEKYAYRCPVCKAIGPLADSWEEAEKKWCINEDI